jgi:hypothetical protein
MHEVKKARELDWDDTDKDISLLSGSEPVRARVIVHRGQTVTVSDSLSGKVLTLSPEDYLVMVDPAVKQEGAAP